MKSNIKSLLKYIPIIGICVSLMSCDSTSITNDLLPEPQIKAGVVKIYGKLNDPMTKIPSLILRFENPVTADESIIETKVEQDGSFYFEAPIECSTVFSSIYSPGGHGGVLIELSADEDIRINLKLGNTGKIKIEDVSGNSLLTNQDKENIGDVLVKYATYRYDMEPILKMTPEEYALFEMNMMKTRTDYAMKGANFSNAGNYFILNALKLFHLRGALLLYKERVEMLFKGKYDLGNWSPCEPDIKYYSFLKSFDLNNPLYLYNSDYPITMQRLLSAKALNISPISETPVNEWLEEVKAILAELMGFNSGQFYDMLAAHAYAKQFIDELNPLSDKQKENILCYFGDGEIAKILLRKNEQIVGLATKQNAVIINHTPAVSKEKLMDGILSNYKGKGVVVDFWATWCSPCVDAMKQMDVIKSQLKDNDIVFVYITNESSPKELWNQKIKSIFGEHYYVNSEEWDYLLALFDFSSIPTHLFFDAHGLLKEKITGYPGNIEMQKRIEELL